MRRQRSLRNSAEFQDFIPKEMSNQIDDFDADLDGELDDYGFSRIRDNSFAEVLKLSV